MINKSPRASIDDQLILNWLSSSYDRLKSSTFLIFKKKWRRFTWIIIYGIISFIKIAIINNIWDYDDEIYTKELRKLLTLFLRKHFFSPIFLIIKKVEEKESYHHIGHMLPIGCPIINVTPFYGSLWATGALLWESQIETHCYIHK